ncbi:hypothetical protein B0A50_04723 [Salinomyces thailandicus]|uniref:Uncharacterized protein n=1 Tax=Salinomyces thailandicus TaxID=706561 RepID=A0A4U0TXQ9_9PEZI|nr:hypothetical protein B0A50_04723 [Salinomyces thailandica]
MSANPANVPPDKGGQGGSPLGSFGEPKSQEPGDVCPAASPEKKTSMSQENNAPSSAGARIRELVAPIESTDFSPADSNASAAGAHDPASASPTQHDLVGEIARRADRMSDNEHLFDVLADFETRLEAQETAMVVKEANDKRFRADTDAKIKRLHVDIEYLPLKAAVEAAREAAERHSSATLDTNVQNEIPEPRQDSRAIRVELQHLRDDFKRLHEKIDYLDIDNERLHDNDHRHDADMKSLRIDNEGVHANCQADREWLHDENKQLHAKMDRLDVDSMPKMKATDSEAASPSQSNADRASVSPVGPTSNRADEMKDMARAEASVAEMRESLKAAHQKADQAMRCLPVLCEDVSQLRKNNEFIKGHLRCLHDDNKSLRDEIKRLRAEHRDEIDCHRDEIERVRIEHRDEIERARADARAGVNGLRRALELHFCEETFKKLGDAIIGQVFEQLDERALPSTQGQQESHTPESTTMSTRAPPHEGQRAAQRAARKTKDRTSQSTSLLGKQQSSRDQPPPASPPAASTPRRQPFVQRHPVEASGSLSTPLAAVAHQQHGFPSQQRGVKMSRAVETVFGMIPEESRQAILREPMAMQVLTEGPEDFLLYFLPQETFLKGLVNFPDIVLAHLEIRPAPVHRQ